MAKGYDNSYYSMIHDEWITPTTHSPLLELYPAGTTYADVYKDLVKQVRTGEKPMFPGTETPQAAIDRKVKEKLEEPKIAAEEARQTAEVERRIALVDLLKTDSDYEFGTVFKFERRFGQDTEYTKSTKYQYVVFKAGDGNWYMTGKNTARTGGWKFDALVEWMVTGEHAIENLKVATAWADIF